MPFYHFLSSFSGSCCIKMAHIYSKSTFIACFDLIMSGNRFILKLFYEIFLVYQIFNIFNCHCALFGSPPKADLGPMISPPSVRSFVCPAIFLKTTSSIFLFFCTDLYNNETKKVTFLVFEVQYE